jgi:hypothetical protein
MKPGLHKAVHVGRNCLHYRMIQRFLRFVGSVFGLFTKIITVVIPLAFLILVSQIIFTYPLGFVFIKLIDPKSDTTGITNYGFAILAAFASIAFSWSRAVNPENKEKIKRIVEAGEDWFKSAILFLFASGIKFMSFKSVELVSVSGGSDMVKVILIFFYLIVFGMSLIFLSLGLYRIGKVFLS